VSNLLLLCFTVYDIYIRRLLNASISQRLEDIINAVDSLRCDGARLKAKFEGKYKIILLVNIVIGYENDRKI
jgi:hypothetical protein